MPETPWRRAGNPSSDWWIEAFSFPSMQEAGLVYRKVSSVLKAAGATDGDASVYRITLNGLPLVVTLGRSRPGWEATYLQMRLECLNFDEVLLPPEVELALLERSAQVWAQNTGFIERRNVNEVVE